MKIFYFFLFCKCKDENFLFCKRRNEKYIIKIFVVCIRKRETANFHTPLHMKGRNVPLWALLRILLYHVKM